MFELRVRFHDAEKSELGRIRNFGEDLWRAFRDRKEVEIDIAEIDRAFDEIRLRCRRTYVRKAVETTSRVMRENMVDREADILISEHSSSD